MNIRSLSLIVLTPVMILVSCMEPVAKLETSSSSGSKESANSAGASNPSVNPPVGSGPAVAQTPLGGQSPIVSPGPQSPQVQAPSPMAPAPTPGPAVSPSTGAVAKGSVSVALTYVKPSTQGSHQSKGHVRAVWITVEKDGVDTYVRTIESFGKIRSNNLRRWNFFSGSTVIDGYTGATKSYVQNGLKDPQVNLTWDLKNTDGKVQAQGKYKVWFELSTGNTEEIDEDKVADPQDIGGGYAFYAFPFELTAAGTSVQDNKNPVFTNIKVVHTAK